MALLATVGAKALYLLFLWLISAATAAWMADRKGYGEKVGLTFGLILSVVGLVVVLILPGRPGSVWKEDGPFPRRGRGPRTPVSAQGPAFAERPEVAQGRAGGDPTTPDPSSPADPSSPGGPSSPGDPSSPGGPSSPGDPPRPGGGGGAAS